MSTEYTALVADMWAAFGAEPFTWSFGSFSRTREFDAGSLGWPRRFDNRTDTPSWRAWKTVHEAERTAHNTRNT